VIISTCSNAYDDISLIATVGNELSTGSYPVIRSPTDNVSIAVTSAGVTMLVLVAKPAKRLMVHSDEQHNRILAR
jgi:hypothetical protein